MTDPEWADLLLIHPYPELPQIPANATQAQIAAIEAHHLEVLFPTYRPAPRPPLLPPDTGTEAQFRRYGDKQTNYVIYANGLQHLKKMIVDSLGDSIIAAMETEAVPVDNMSIAQILEYLVNTYGITTKSDVQTLLDSCSNPCASMADFYAHAQRLSNLYQQLDRKEATIAKFQQMKYLEDSTKHIDAIDEARVNYLIANPTYLNQSFEAMVTFTFRQQLQNKVPTVRSLSFGAAVTGKPPTAKVLVASMDTVTDLLLSVVERLDRTEKALSKNKDKNKEKQLQ